MLNKEKKNASGRPERLFGNLMLVKFFKQIENKLKASKIIQCNIYIVLITSWLCLKNGHQEFSKNVFYYCWNVFAFSSFIFAHFSYSFVSHLAFFQSLYELSRQWLGDSSTVHWRLYVSLTWALQIDFLYFSWIRFGLNCREVVLRFY